MSSDDQDDLAPLMQAVVYEYPQYMVDMPEWEALVRRKAEQYGAWQRAEAIWGGIENESSRNAVNACRAAYFETEAAE